MNTIPGYAFRILFFGIAISNCTAQQTFPVNGIADSRHITYALTNAKIFVDYQSSIDSAALLVRDGKILEAGKNIAVPADAFVIDLKGKFIYPSFIDLDSDYGMPEAKKDRGEDRGPQFLSNKNGAYNWNEAIRPETNASSQFSADEKKAAELRKIGFGTVLTFQHDGIARGSSVLVTLGNGNENELVLREKAAANYSFNKGSSTQDYPSSLMGAIALLRQTYYDAQWYVAGGYKKEANLSLDAWNKLQTLPQIFEAGDKLNELRAAVLGNEFNVKYILKGNGDEYQRLDELKATGSSFIVPINFPAPLDVTDPYEALNVSLAAMKHWELAPANLAAMARAGLNFAITSAGLKDKKDFWKNIRKAMDNGLTQEQALKALTRTPAELLRVSSEVGSLKKGMLANFVITSKNIFDKDNVIYENWGSGKRYKVNDIDLKDIRGTYKLNVASDPVMKLKVFGEILSPEATIQDDTNKVKAVFTRSGTLVSIEYEMKRKPGREVVRLSGSVSDKEKTEMSGNGQLANGEWVSWSAVLDSAFTAEAKKDTTKPVISEGKITFPNSAYGWTELPKQKTVIIKNATVWTNEPEGILQNTDVVMADGKIKQIGKNLSFPNAEIVDGTGKHLTSGIIDEHSHIAISNGVNEGTQSVTSEVRIGDVLNSDDVNIYRQLAGGVTVSHLLHGSANTIGGQTQLIKLRWGLPPEKLKFEGWGGFIKFALGENVKQSNWGDRQTVRFPQTRMGVEQTIVDAFTRAKEYEAALKKYTATDSKTKTGLTPPRKDLELDALVEILNDKRFITCHSYVQSEINMLIRTADRIGFRVNTFTHILEGYKVADKMKKHGAGGSSFSDWWAYKYEVMEAIPHNGAIMHKVGITVAYNSDDGEMARRLNQEAAKAMKYGGVSEEDAWKFVTLNPAKLLHIDNRTGSIKEGKDADLVLWTNNPLSVYATVYRTYVDGICYYKYRDDQNMRVEIQKEKARIARKMIEAKNKGEKTEKPAESEDGLYHCIEEPMN
ncbi:MAG TPA: amidohydrolase family protein [Bacteroidia bacterium]|nr:amidohydrolase family protein [Bacteroidia bacterium]